MPTQSSQPPSCHEWLRTSNLSKTITHPPTAVLYDHYNTSTTTTAIAEVGLNLCHSRSQASITSCSWNHDDQQSARARLPVNLRPGRKMASRPDPGTKPRRRTTLTLDVVLLLFLVTCSQFGSPVMSCTRIIDNQFQYSGTHRGTLHSVPSNQNPVRSFCRPRTTKPR
ncbi:hypothetical protein BDZ45DRAFT_735374 [Acephala macrosclerotiorum]|nr:hypothetical protein BDZ45DRAFT_735374 [Acephala macrosclerotiorum]